MNFLNTIENNSILIIPNNIKEKVLLNLDKNKYLKNIKIMDLNDLKKNYYFDYTTESICHIINKYNLTYDFAFNILNYLYYIENKNYENDKLNFLVTIKNDLINNDLLLFNNLFKEYIKNKKIYVYGYDYINKFFNNILKELNSTTIYKETKKFDHNVYEFETIDDEVLFVANQICKLVSENINLEKIKIIKPPSEYETVIKRIFKLFNIPINFDNSYLYSTNLVNSFFNLINENINITLNKLKEMYDLNNDYIKIIYNQIIDVCNKYNWCNNFIGIKDILKEEFKKTKINYPKLKNAVEFIELEDNVFDDEFIFILGFNQNSFPKNYKDDEYISDNIKNNLLLETTSEKNLTNYNNLIVSIKSIKNLFVSYKLKSPFQTFYPSQIIEECNFNIIKERTKNLVSYSKIADKLNLANKLDNYFKYGTVDSDISILYNTYQDIDYKTYSNQYNIIDDKLFRDYLKNNLLLSYSSINNFYHCSFKYYIENILKLNNYKNDFTLLIGNLFHYVLSMMYNENFDFENVFNDYLSKNYNIKTYKEQFFLSILKKELEYIVNVIKEQDNYTTFDNYLFEEVVNIDLSKNNYKITFKGIIDKIMYKQNNENTLISIIDYKTGNPNLNLNNIIYGIDMQLCIYAYLSSKMKKFANPKLVGIYLQKVLNNEINIDKKKNYDVLKRDNLKLQGYSTDKESILKEFDTTYNDSKLIKGLKIGKNGFYAYSKIFDEAMLNSILDITKKNIDGALDKIIDREFYINPKKIGIKNLIGCEYCTYKDLCFMTEDNIINLKEYKNLEFLKGDKNEMD